MGSQCTRMPVATQIGSQPSAPNAVGCHDSKTHHDHRKHRAVAGSRRARDSGSAGGQGHVQGRHVRYRRPRSVSRARRRRQECGAEDRRCHEDGGNANESDDQGSDDGRASDACDAEDHRADDADAIHAARFRGRSGTEHCVACGASIARGPTINDCTRSGRKDHCGRRDRAMQGRHLLALEDAHGRLLAARRRLEVDGQAVAGFVSAKTPNASHQRVSSRPIADAASLHRRSASYASSAPVNSSPQP